MEKEKKKGLFRVCTTIESEEEEEGPPPNFSLSLSFFSFSLGLPPPPCSLGRHSPPPSHLSTFLSLSLSLRSVDQEGNKAQKKEIGRGICFPPLPLYHHQLPAEGREPHRAVVVEAETAAGKQVRGIYKRK